METLKNKNDIRLFIAVDIILKRKLIDVYYQIQKQLNAEKIKWVSLDNFHLTLKFLGATPVSKVDDIYRVISNVASNFSSFQIELKGIGVFPNKLRPRVLWLGINNYQSMTQIANDLDMKLSFLGFEQENRIFKPHLTIGRIKYLRKKYLLDQILTNYHDTFFGTQKITEIILYQSILKPEGAVYKPLKIIKLRNNE